MRYTKTRRGFTIVELIIVIAVIAIAIPAVFGVFFSMLQARLKVVALEEVKRNGDSAINIMKHMIQNNAVAIYSDNTLNTQVCNTSASSSPGPLYFKDKDNLASYFNFKIDSDRISISGPSAVLNYITNLKTITSNFSVSCSRTIATYNTFPIVTISFDITAAAASTRQEEKAKLNYRAKIKLRNSLDL